MALERQSKFFNKQYLETRLGEFKEIKKKEILFKIEESDRVFSKSLYIEFYTMQDFDKGYKNHTLRISDHPLKDCPHTQFIVEPNECLTKKKKAQFVRAVETSIKKAQMRNLYKELGKLTKGGENQ